jgi:DNA segregation ATPase FtsK/SpoIIIE-like protein
MFMATITDRRRRLREARLQHQLEVQSRQIERVFSHHQLTAQVAGGRVQRWAIDFDLQTQLSAGLERLRGLKEDLKAALGVADVQLRREGGQWRLHVARPYEPPVGLLPLMALIEEQAPALPPATAVLGLAEDGRPILLDFAAAPGHLLITGGPQAGKTVLLRTIAASLALTSKQSQAQLVILDAGGPDAPGPALLPLELLPHMLGGICVAPQDVTAVLAFLVNEMDYRREQDVRLPRIVVLIDHAVRLLAHGESDVVTALHRLIQRGAAAGIHLALSTQRPDAPQLGALLKANLPLRIVGQMPDAQARALALEDDNWRAADLLGAGDFMLLRDGVATHFQAAYLGDYDLHLKLEDLYRAAQPILLAQPFDTRVRLPELPEDL